MNYISKSNIVCIEEPGASPQITDIKSPTNSTIELVWKPLKPENVNGVLKSYRIVYGILGANEVQVNTIQDPNQTVSSSLQSAWQHVKWALWALL